MICINVAYFLQIKLYMFEIIYPKTPERHPVHSPEWNQEFLGHIEAELEDPTLSEQLRVSLGKSRDDLRAKLNIN